MWAWLRRWLRLRKQKQYAPEGWTVFKGSSLRHRYPKKEKDVPPPGKDQS